MTDWNARLVFSMKLGSLYVTCHLLDAFLLDICGTSGVFLYCFLSFVHAKRKGLLLRLAVKQSQVHSVVETCLTSLMYWIKIFSSSEWCIWKWGLLISRTKWTKILLPQSGVTRINNQRIGISNASCCSQTECTICHWHGLCRLCWIPADLENKSAVKSEKSKVGKLSWWDTLASDTVGFNHSILQGLGSCWMWWCLRWQMEKFVILARS